MNIDSTYNNEKITNEIIRLSPCTSLVQCNLNQEIKSPTHISCSTPVKEVVAQSFDSPVQPHSHLFNRSPCSTAAKK